MSRTRESLPAGDTPPAPGYWKASDGRWYPPETHPGYRPPVGSWQPPSWKREGGPPAGGRRAPRRVTIAVLATLWAVSLLVPTVFTALTGDDLVTDVPGRVLMGLSSAALMVSAGFIFRRHGSTRQLVAATAVGVFTEGVAAAIRVLTSSGYREDYPPWGAVLIINVVVNGLLVVLGVALGVALGQAVAAWMGRRRSRPAGR